MGRSSGADGFVRCLLLVAAHRRAGESTAPQIPQTGVKLSAWITDWQWRTGITDMEHSAPSLKRSIFAAYFNHKDELHFTSDFRRGLNFRRFPERGAASPGPDHRKRSLLIPMGRRNRRILSSSPGSWLLRKAAPAYRAHSGAVSQHGFRGVELDYEKVRKEDWANLCALYEELYERLQAEGFSLRIVLEPGSPSHPWSCCRQARIMS